MSDRDKFPEDWWNHLIKDNGSEGMVHVNPIQGNEKYGHQAAGGGYGW